MGKAWADKKKDAKDDNQGQQGYGGGGNVTINGQSQSNLTSAVIASANAKSGDSYNF